MIDDVTIFIECGVFIMLFTALALLGIEVKVTFADVLGTRRVLVETDVARQTASAGRTLAQRRH